MKAHGVGPWFALAAALLLGAAGALEFAAPRRGALPAIPRTARLVAGSALIGGGVAVWLWSLALVLPAFSAGRLVTHGPYRLCRNPAYASWILLILPGFALVRDSWVKLAALVPLYLVTLLLVRKEERFLDGAFGAAWREYRARVPALLPRPWPGRGGPPAEVP